MSYQLNLPTQLTTDERYVTLLLPADSVMPTISEQWDRLGDERIKAWYTRPQLCEVVLAGLTIAIERLQKRLESGEAMIAEARGRDDVATVEMLEKHWVDMLERMVRLLDAQARIL